MMSTYLKFQQIQELRELFREHAGYLQHHFPRLTWLHNPPLSARWGGHFECLIGVAKKTMKELIHYVYTGELTGARLNVRMVAWVADKYNLPGMMDILCTRMKEGQVVDPKNIADILIAAGKTHQHFLR